MIQCLDCGLAFDDMDEFNDHAMCRKIGYRVVEVETWRVYPGDVGMMKFKSGRFLKISMAPDGTHAMVRFSKGLGHEVHPEG